MTIRDVQPDDYAALAAIHNALNPANPATAEVLLFTDTKGDARLKARRWVLEHDGEVIGTVRYFQRALSYAPGRFHLTLTVHPDHHGQGHGKALYAHVLKALKRLKPSEIIASTRDNQLRGVRFAQDRGFEEMGRIWAAVLDVDNVDLAPYTALENRLAARGITITTLAALADDPDRDRKLYDLEMTAMQDDPTALPTPPDFAMWQGRVLQSPALLPEGYLIAVQGTEYVGSSVLVAPPNVTELNSTFTGVRSDQRRRGIGLVLKGRGIAFAQANGYHTIISRANPANLPIMALNARVGFVQQPTVIHFRRAWKGVRAT